MKQWLEEAARLVDGFAQLQQGRIKAKRLKEDVEGFKTKLGAALQQLGAADQGSLPELLERANFILAEAQRRWGEQTSLQQALSDQQAALSRDQETLKAAQEKEQAWSSRWAEAMEQLALPASTTVQVAKRYVAALQQLFELLDQLREAERRRDQQRKFKEAYEAKVQQVAHQCALDLPLESIPWRSGSS